MHKHSKWPALVTLLLACVTGGEAQQPATTDPGVAYTVFLRQRPVGQESVQSIATSEGFTIRGSNRLGPPLDVVTRTAEIHYTSEWRPTRMLLEGTTRGE